jgi:hypothetical protein
LGHAAANASAGPAAWLQAACAPPGGFVPRILRRSPGDRLAALAEVGCGAGIASHVLISEGEALSWQDLAVFEGRVEAMEWQGAELLLGFPAGAAMRVFSVYPGMRVRDAKGPGELRWVRLSTRRSRR